MSITRTTSIHVSFLSNCLGQRCSGHCWLELLKGKAVLCLSGCCFPTLRKCTSEKTNTQDLRPFPSPTSASDGRFLYSPWPLAPPVGTCNLSSFRGSVLFVDEEGWLGQWKLISHEDTGLQRQAGLGGFYIWCFPWTCKRNGAPMGGSGVLVWKQLMARGPFH